MQAHQHTQTRMRGTCKPLHCKTKRSVESHGNARQYKPCAARLESVQPAFGNHAWMFDMNVQRMASGRKTKWPTWDSGGKWCKATRWPGMVVLLLVEQQLLCHAGAARAISSHPEVARPSPLQHENQETPWTSPAERRQHLRAEQRMPLLIRPAGAQPKLPDAPTTSAQGT